MPIIRKTPAFEPQAQSILCLMMILVTLFGHILIFSRYLPLDAVQADFNKVFYQVTVTLRCFVSLWSLSCTRVFEARTATGSELFSFLTCPHTTTFTLLSIFSPPEISSIKIWETIRSWQAKCSLPVAGCASKTSVLKLPIVVVERLKNSSEAGKDEWRDSVVSIELIFVSSHSFLYSC